MSRQPARVYIIAYGRMDEYGDELDVVDHMRNLGGADCHGQCAVQGQELVETPGYVMCDRNEGRNGRVFRL